MFGAAIVCADSSWVSAFYGCFSLAKKCIDKVNIANLRNIGIIAHIDAGKTTVTERMLYYCGTSHKVGQVDKGTTVTDYDPEEQERGITIQSACVSFAYKDIQINLIDTPGHVDFTAEVERSLRVLDGGVVVFSAREGVEAQSETVWHQADKYNVPRIAFINKMDREGADFFATVEQIEKRLDGHPLVIALPVGAGPPHVANAFSAVIDLIEMKQLVFDPINEGAKISVEPIPENMLDEATEWRGQMLEELSLVSDELTELLLDDKPIPSRLIHSVLREATLKENFVPILCGSALDGIGVQPVLDGVARYLPSPLDMPPVTGIDPKSKKEATLSRKPIPDEPFCALVFKILADRHGDMHWVRIYSGTLKANSRVFNPGKDKKENVPQLWHIQADRREQIEQAEAGQIVGIIGLRHSVTGDTLCEPKNPILLESITFPETVISMAIEPENATERKKLATVLDMMKRQDPTFRGIESEETGQTLISGMGELHLEVIKHRLLREFKLNVRVHNPRVSYRETIQNRVEVIGQCHRAIGGQTMFAELTIRFEPFAKGTSPVTVIPACGEALPPEFLGPTIEALREAGEGGGQLGYPLMNVKATILDAAVHETDSNEIAFRIAVADAFQKGLRAAGVVLLEPIMNLEVTTPDEYLGDFVSDLQKRRAIITETGHRGKIAIIKAQTPLAELFGYSSAMRGLSQGRATSTMEPSNYGPAPPEVLNSFI
jgi:elongation factor G